MIKKISKTVERNFTKALIYGKNYDTSQNYYIFSDPRGGSTWLMEIIQTITKSTVVWEPLHLGIKDNPFKEINFGWRQHIPENAEWDEAKEIFDMLFTGRILVRSPLSHTPFFDLMNSERLLFKMCRGSALLPWLIKNYSFSFKPIYLIRHPFAVASSQMRHGAWDNDSFSEYTTPNIPFNDMYIEHEPFLKTLKTQEEALVAKWCLANNVPLNHRDNNIRWLTIHYEEFVLDPEKTTDKILQSWGIEYDLSTIDFKKNSKTTKGDSPNAVVERLSDWQKKFDKEQLKKMGRVLEYFDVNCYSTDNPLPAKKL